MKTEKHWQALGGWDGLEYFMGEVFDNFQRLDRAGCPLLARFKENLAGKSRRFDALQAALFARYNWMAERNQMDPDLKTSWETNIQSQADDIQGQIASACATGDFSFFRDFAFFLENPMRKFSVLKTWLIKVHFDSASSSAQTQSWYGEELAAWFQNEMGDCLDVSQIYRACRELGIKTKRRENA